MEQLVGESGAEGKRSSEVKNWTEEFRSQEDENAVAGVAGKAGARELA